MGESEKLKDEIKRAGLSRKMEEELDKLTPETVTELYNRLRYLGKVRR